MTQTDYDQQKLECWEEAVLHGALEVDKDLLFDHAFKCGYSLGKQEKDAEETVISGWVARNRYNELYLYTEKPHRINCGIVFGEHTDAWSSGDLSFFPLDKELFPDLTWESEPQECEIIIKRKNSKQE